MRRLFLSALGGVYGLAFVSLWVQIDGLLGSEGISPASPWLERVAEALGPAAVLRVPTIFWLNASDAALHVVCALGTLLSLLLIVGVLPRAALFGLWGLYLSLASVGGVFLGYQWDALLIETGLMALFLAPPLRLGLRCWSAPVSMIGVWLLRWLLFRLMFLSGFVKLASGDETWRTLTALEFHYFTQPIPAWTSYYAHHLPSILQKASALAMFAIELGVPFLIFCGARARRWAFVALVGLQLLIGTTGNYGFFNLLTGALCITLLDDETLVRWLPWLGRVPASTEAMEAPKPDAERKGARVAAAVAGSLLLILGLIQVESVVFGRLASTDFVRSVMSIAAPFRSVNRYGLFAVMTTTRPEIVLEGSRDGAEWRAYTFRWKPGALDRRPELIGPHMPRLDWQMWFAALGSCRSNPWFHAFMSRILEGSSPVLALLGRNPFPDAPPRFLRSTVYRYEFAPMGVGSADWWVREEVGPYCPTVTLGDDGLRTVGAR